MVLLQWWPYVDVVAVELFSFCLFYSVAIHTSFILVAKFLRIESQHEDI